MLEDIEGIKFSYLTDVDVARNELVKRIIKAYREYDLSRKVSLLEEIGEKARDDS